MVNPKVLFICAAAGLAIGTAGLRAPAVWSAELWYVAGRRARRWRSRSSPTRWQADRLDEPLARLKDWMERQHATLVAVILVVIGLLVLYKGIHGL